MARTLTEEQRARRAEAARKNRAPSKGPVTSAGQYNRSRRRLSHGCYAKVHSLPDEPPEMAEDLRARWFREKNPQTVEAELLVEECYRGHLMQRRYHRARDEVLTQQ